MKYYILLLLTMFALNTKATDRQTNATSTLTVVAMDTTNPGGFNCPATIAVFFKFESTLPHTRWNLHCPEMLLSGQNGEWSADTGVIIRADISTPIKRSIKYTFVAYAEEDINIAYTDTVRVENLPGKGCDGTINTVNIAAPSFLGTADGSMELSLNKSYCGFIDVNTKWEVQIINACNNKNYASVAQDDNEHIIFSNLEAGSYIAKFDYLGGVCVDTSGFTNIVVPNADGTNIFVKSKYYKDVDGDLFGNDNDFVESCTPVDNRVLAGGDCDDNDASVNPGKTEIPGNGKDDDCDGAIDEEVVMATYYADFDHDGFGNPAFPLQAEEGHQPTGYVINNIDCDDTDPEVPTQDLSMKPLWQITNPLELGYYAVDYEYKRGKNKLPVTVAATNDSGAIVVGTKYNYQGGSTSNYPNNANTDFYLQRLDKTGKKLWEKSYGLNNGFVTQSFSSSIQVSWSKEHSSSVTQTSDGGFAIGGTSFYGKTAGYTWCVIDRVTCIQCPEVTCSPAPLYASSPSVIKTDANGNQLWSWSLPVDFEYSGDLYKIKETKDKGIICLGRKTKNSTRPGAVINSSNYNPDLIPSENTKYYIVKLSAGGSLTWQQEVDFFTEKQIKDYFLASPVDITENSDGSFICTGNNLFHTQDPWEESYHNILFKLSSGGQLVWSKNMDDTKAPGMLTAANDGGFYFAADVETGAQTPALQVSKMDGSGNSLWTKLINSSNVDRAVPSGIFNAVAKNITSLDTNINGNLIVATSNKVYQLLPNGDIVRENKIDSSNYAGTISADRGYLSLQFNEISRNSLKLSKYAEPQVNDLCNGKDDDCDGLIDEDAPQLLWYRDSDGDSYGNPDDTIRNCSQPEGYVSDSTDCNDLNALVNPDVKEICNGIDDNCNGIIDDIFETPVIISPVDNPVSVCFNYTDPPLTAIQGDNFSYQWKIDGQNITGATTPYLQPAVTGGYRVRVYTPGGCSVFSEVKRIKTDAPITATITPGNDLDLCTLPKRGQALLKGPLYQNISYVWYRINSDGSIDILGTTKNYTATQPGEYRLTIKTIPGCYESTAAVTITGNCTAALSNTVTFDEATDDETITKTAGVQLYPNPANNVLHVSGLGSANGSIEIVNMTAQTVYKQQVYGNNISIDVSRFANGVYLFKYNNGNVIKTIKFIKQ